MICASPIFTAEQLLLAGRVTDRGQLSDGQRAGLDYLVERGLARMGEVAGLTVWWAVGEADRDFHERQSQL